MIRSCLFAALALASLVVSARAEPAQMHIPDSPFCIKEADATAKVQAFLKAHDGATLDVLDDESAAAWIDAYNNGLPPSTDYQADKIWIISDPKRADDTLLLELFVRGETCHGLMLPMRMFAAIVAHERENRQ